MPKKMLLFRQFPAGLLILSLILGPNSAYALRVPQPEAPPKRAGLEEALEGDQTPLSERLLLYAADHPESSVRWKDQEGPHFDPKRLKEALSETRDRVGAIGKAVQAAEQFTGEIHIVRDGAPAGFSGVFYDEETDTLYLARDLLPTANPLMIRAAIEYPRTGLAPVQVFAAELQAQRGAAEKERVRPHPKASSRKGSSPSRAASSETKPVSAGSDTPALKPKPDAAQTVPAPEPAPADSVPDKPPAAPQENPALKKELVTIREAAEKGILIPNTLVVGARLDESDGEELTVSFDAQASQLGFENPILYKNSDMQPLIPGFDPWRGRVSVKNRRFMARLPGDLMAAACQAADLMGTEWSDRLTELQKLLEDEKFEMKRPEAQRRVYLSKVLEAAIKVLTAPDLQGKDPGGRLEKQPKGSAAMVIPVFRERDRRMIRFYSKVEKIEESLEAQPETAFSAQEAQPLLGELLEEMPPASMAREVTTGFMQALAETQAFDREQFLTLLQELKTDMILDGIPILTRVMGWKQLEVLFYDTVRVVRLERFSALQQRVEGSTLTEEVSREILSLAQQVKLMEWEAAFHHLLLNRAKPAARIDKVTSFPIKGLGILFLNPDGSVRRFVPGGGASILRPGWSPSYFSYRIAGWD